MDDTFQRSATRQHASQAIKPVLEGGWGGREIPGRRSLLAESWRRGRDGPKLGGMGPYNSTYTRVVPVFDALADSGPSDWLRRLLGMARYGHPTATVAPDLDWALTAPLLYGDQERPLAPPVALLRWLCRHVTDWTGKGLSSSGAAADARRRLIARDPETVREALALLDGPVADSGWHILEGPSYPDVFAETANSILVVEGKRTERSLTTTTKWMPARHQMLRHIDAAWEIRGAKRVYGLLIVNEETPSYQDGGWKRDCESTWSDQVATASLPHRDAVERLNIAQAFVGMTTWQAIVREMSLVPDLLARHETVLARKA